MKRFVSSILVAVMMASNIGMAAQQRNPVQRSKEYWFAYADKLPIGSTVSVRTADGKRLTAVLAIVDREGITLEQKTRIPEPPLRIAFDQLAQLELKQGGTSVGKAVAIGVATGAATFFGILLFIAAALD